MAKVIVIGGSYAGLTAVLELRRLLPADHSVTLVSARENFFFFPSLIWVIQGEREISDLSFPLQPVLDEAGVEFIHRRLTRIDPEDKIVDLDRGLTLDYDYLVIATGGEWEWDAVPGSQPKPEGHSVSMLSPQAAVTARQDWNAILTDPGPVTVGVALNAGLYGAAYELALNLDTALRKAGVREDVPITFITPEPFLGHLGHGGLGHSRQILESAFARQEILALTETQIKRVEAEAVFLAGRAGGLPSKFTVIVPPYLGIQPVRETPDLADSKGLIPVDNHFRSLRYQNIYGVGTAIQLQPPDKTLLPCGVLVTGKVSAEMGRAAAANLAAEFGIGQPSSKSPIDLKSFYVLDSGSQGLFMSLGSQSWLNLQVNLPGPWSHWAKLIAEDYQMWQLKSGRF
ncbi:MAG: FAD-dependent oxidoreductase [Anaerolineales bacterium]|nr:FAD-dependent oxidoreductase [Anaerolineales bacterium]